MQIINGDLIDIIKQNKCSVAIHVANCHHAMGAGVAAALRKNFPEVYAADCSTICSDYNKMGTISVAQLNEFPSVIVANLYAQYNYGTDKSQLDYDALTCCLKKIKYFYEDQIIAYPYLMGCGLAGGDWDTVSKIIDFEFSKMNHFAVRLQS